jgi:hypothetical protein
MVPEITCPRNYLSMLPALKHPELLDSIHLVRRDSTSYSLPKLLCSRWLLRKGKKLEMLAIIAICDAKRQLTHYFVSSLPMVLCLLIISVVSSRCFITKVRVGGEVGSREARSL